MQALVLLPEWQCGDCSEQLQADRGCHEPALKPVKLEGEPQTRCPRRPLLDKPAWFTEVFWLYSNYQNGILPEGGGLQDQPHKLMAVIRHFIGVRAEAEQEKDDKHRRRQAFRDRAKQAMNPGTP